MAIFYSTTFSFADYEQAKARLHRIGQHHPVTYIHLVAEHTVDEDILGILKSKKDMATQIVDSMRNKLFLGFGKKLFQKPFTNPSKGDNMIIRRNKKMKKPIKLSSKLTESLPAGVCSKCGAKFYGFSITPVKCPSCRAPWSSTKKGESKLIGLDNRQMGGWYWDEETKRIVRRDADGALDYLATASTLEEAKSKVAKLKEKSSEGEEPMSSKKERKAAAAAKRDKKSKKAVQVIEETVEEVEEEVAEEPKKKSKKERRTEKAAKEEAEKAAPEAKTKKSKKAQKAEKAEEPEAKAPIDEDAVGVKELSEMVNIDPKALRKLLREEFPDHEPKSQWTWERNSKALTSLVKKLNK